MAAASIPAAAPGGPPLAEAPRIVVVGAGAIGCTVGGRLSAAGHDVTMLGHRPLPELEGGWTLVDLDGDQARVQPRLAIEPNVLAAAELVLVCVKSQDTYTVARTIADHAARDVRVVSLQNGVRNAARLRESGRAVVPGMVPFNVVRPAPDVFRQATEGTILLGADTSDLAVMLTEAGLPAQTRDEFDGILWSKLMLNLNNALNALSGRPLRDHLQDRDWRRVFAACVDEGLEVMRARGTKPTRIGRVHPRIVPLVLRLPNWLFERVAAAMLRIDPDARSSTLDALEAGRPSEVDDLNGEVVREGERLGVPTPANALVMREVAKAFETGRSPRMDARLLLDRLRQGASG